MEAITSSGLKRANSFGLTICRWVIECGMPLLRALRACSMPFSDSRTARSPMAWTCTSQPRASAALTSSPKCAGSISSSPCLFEFL
ncbi:hypothetical protein D3C85_1315620 [compost metagenome]